MCRRHLGDYEYYIRILMSYVIFVITLSLLLSYYSFVASMRGQKAAK